MLMLERYQRFLRFWAVLTLIIFLPSSVEAWNFMPLYTAVESVAVAARELPLDARAERELHRQRVARAVETDGRFRLLDDRVLEDSRSVLPPIDELLPKPERLPDPFALSREYLGKGLLDLASADASRMSARKSSPTYLELDATKFRIPSGILFLSRTLLTMFETAIAQSITLEEGFHTTTSPQTMANIAFHAHTATGKLKAEITPTMPSG